MKLRATSSISHCILDLLAVCLCVSYIYVSIWPRNARLVPCCITKVFSLTVSIWRPTWHITILTSQSINQSNWLIHKVPLKQKCQTRRHEQIWLKNHVLKPDLKCCLLLQLLTHEVHNQQFSVTKFSPDFWSIPWLLPNSCQIFS